METKPKTPEEKAAFVMEADAIAVRCSSGTSPSS